MPDYILKSKVLKEGSLLKTYRNCSKLISAFVYGKNPPSLVEYDNANKTSFYFSKRFPDEWKECGRISHAHSQRVSRLKKFIYEMVFNADCLFLTFTFTDRDLERTSESTRRQAVRRFLTDLNVPYVANIDFGGKNNREHYHAVVGIDNVDFKLWDYGAINGKHIRNDIRYDENGNVTSETVARLARYVAKLTNHAIKETTRRNAAIYSRKHYVCIDRKYYEVNSNGEKLND